MRRKIVIVTTHGPCIVTEKVWKKIQEAGIKDRLLLTLFVPKDMGYRILNGSVPKIHRFEDFTRRYLPQEEKQGGERSIF